MIHDRVNMLQLPRMYMRRWFYNTRADLALQLRGPRVLFFAPVSFDGEWEATPGDQPISSHTLCCVHLYIRGACPSRGERHRYFRCTEHYDASHVWAAFFCAEGTSADHLTHAATAGRGQVVGELRWRRQFRHRPERHH